MISVGKLYQISSRFKYLRVAVHTNKPDGFHDPNPPYMILDRKSPFLVFLVLDWNMSDNDTFYQIKALIGDKVGYFNIFPKEIEEITV